MPVYLRYSTLIQKQIYKNILFFAVGISSFAANVSVVICILLLKIKNFELSYLYKTSDYTNTFRYSYKSISLTQE